MRIKAAILGCLMASAAQAQSVPCGGGFGSFVDGLKAEAIAGGHDAATVNRFFAGVSQSAAVLKADRRQGIFQDPFITFSRKLISQSRLDKGRQMGQRYASVFDRIQTDYGIAPGVLLAFWAFETDYGAFQGDFNTANALVTLAHDCRRPEIFRPQIFAALTLYEHGDFDPRTTTGAWAGEIGMVQMLPKDILENGVDGDGDGHVTLKTSAPDALLSGAKMLSHLGWRPNEPWLQEITMPADFDWSQTGLEVTKSVAEWEQLGVRARAGQLDDGRLQASIILPQGRFGPKFIAYPNFNVYFEWNQSFTYVLTAAYFGTRLMGAPVYDAGNPEPGLQGAQMKQLQTKLAAMGYDVGAIDGILGAGTRAAVRDVQAKLGMPADAWPTAELLNRL
ncbi:lytic murein transglycosylase [Tropicibacter naphthalenivorans]|uniref:Membrane-bound lytic murein transglycosylase B n=1 Tax=Tropicibacter naphthalenivorans TaxID=441103 RepID=A0A0P1G9U1_9RHOB|nr:lytic murein transglycosylase [Tropicibacter naphthalenivorans]CUH78334.1 Membrane-bound lytic murein transglycosylase B precursor [Tropicibacter naphthalenivorans]SMC79675.1 lytic murein transglycosylase [Tropicibacter naphthalenivorans]